MEQMTPPIPSDTNVRNLESVIDNALSARIRRLPSAKTVLRTALGVSAVAGFATLVIETERQRREIASLKDGQQATVSFIKTMVDETKCGSDAYLYLQQVADDEEEETITTWADDDQLPIPFEITEDGWNYETEETNDGH